MILFQREKRRLAVLFFRAETRNKVNLIFPHCKVGGSEEQSTSDLTDSTYKVGGSEEPSTSDLTDSTYKVGGSEEPSTSYLTDSTYTRQKKKRNSKIFPLSFPFNAKMLIVIKCLVLIKSRQNSSVA